MGGAQLDPSRAQAIRYLVASAVPGLLPEGVAVIDPARGVILSPGAADSIAGEQTTVADRESKLEADILNILEARVGAGNARVQVALDIDMEREAVSEHVFNPDGRVVSGKETTEISETSQGSSGSSSTVSVSSNIPEGGEGAAGGSSTQRTETKETVNYDMSEVKREREKLPGSIRRLSVAVFINQIAELPEEEDAEPVLRTAKELETLKQLVAQAAGFNEKRGDTISIETLPFKPLSTDGTLARVNPFGDFMQRHLMSAIQIVVLSIVTLILGLFVVKPLLSAKDAPLAAHGAAPALASAPAAAVEIAATAPPDAIETLKVIASTKTDQTATLIKTWLETEDAA
jgi:flagellar M-ring protein FliF